MRKAKKSHASKWKMTDERFVAFIDIMGFKDMVSRFTSAELYRIMKGIGSGNSWVEHLNEGDKRDNTGARVTITNYSDSIILYSRDGTDVSFNRLLGAVSGIMNTLFEQSVPFKGGLAFGTMTLDTKNSIFFGQPLIDAYLLQEELLFYGVVYHGTAEIQAQKLKENTLSIDYKCPFKSGMAKHTTVYPLFAVDDSRKEYPRHKKLYDGMAQLRFRTSGHLRKYVDNTSEYLAFVQSHLPSAS